MKATILNTPFKKICMSKDYNFVFDKKNGNFARWGEKKEDNPEFSPFGPEILDIEITTKCKGIPRANGKKTPCTFCYKGNTPTGKNMSLDIFKKVLDKMPKTLTQIAFGADSETTANPDLWGMMEYSRECSIIPNITVANVDQTTAEKLAKYCGAVAVSRYDNKDICYDTIKKLTDLGMSQINIHVMVSEETYDMCMETLKDKLTDPRLEKLNAIVLLSLKKKGRGQAFNQLSFDKFKELVDFGMENNIGLGFDSCSAHKFLASIKGRADYKQLEMMSEPCESFGMFSSYINVEGKYFPCSFCEGEEDWKDGPEVFNVKSFLNDIWYDSKMVKWRKIMIDTERKCPIFKI